MNQKLGRQYAEGYEEAQLAVRLVDFLVAKSGCEALRPDVLSGVLERPSQWESDPKPGGNGFHRLKGLKESLKRMIKSEVK